MRIRILPILAIASLFPLVLAPSCGSGGGGGSSGPMLVNQVSNGFGTLLPYRIRLLSSSGIPLNQVIEIRSIQDLLDNGVSETNPVLPPENWPTNAILPNNLPGNHFVFAEFSRPLKEDSVLDLSPAGAVNFGLTGTITVVSVDPTSGATVPVPGRGFIDGMTVVGGAFEDWVDLNQAGQPVALVPQALGFPGVSSNFAGADKLVSKNTFVFIPDADGNLSTFETFPVGKPIRILANTGVRARGGDTLVEEAHASSTVGNDFIPPEVLTDPTTSTPMINPGNGMSNVNPLTDITIDFTEPVQPHRVGTLPSGLPPTASPSTTITFGPPASPVIVAFTALPVSAFNLARYELTPSFNFPGSGGGTVTTVNISVVAGQVTDLHYILPPGNPPVPVNFNTMGVSTSFTTGEGPGITNAPVAPDVIYAGLNGAEPGISVIDLNGFGASSGNPESPFLFPGVPGSPFFWFDPDPPAGVENPLSLPTSKLFFNPNRIWGAGLVPPFELGNSTLNGGSGGVFTLTRDSTLSNRVVRPPILLSANDIEIGHSLDKVANNSSASCLLGGGAGINICAASGFRPTSAQNTIQNAPSPNPPMIFRPTNPSPLCQIPLILGQEVTSVAQPNGAINIEGIGDPFGVPNSGIGGIWPDGHYYTPNNGAAQGAFLGPVDAAAAGGDPTNCANYVLRQQVGHFLYVVDSVQNRIVVLNSNRMTLFDTITLSDPTQIAIEPNLRKLAVTNFGTATVSFIDINPDSATFHQILATTLVGNGPSVLSWQPDNEDLFVCNTLSNNVSILSAADLTVRKTVANQIQNPIGVAVSPRQLGFGFNAGVYFAYILNANGKVAIYESGPDGSNGIGFNEVIGQIETVFSNPKRIATDINDLNSGAWIVHQTSNGEGTVSHIHLNSAPPGPQPIVNFAGVILIPTFRDKEWVVDRVIDPNELSGVPTDIAFDDPVNVGGLGQAASPQVPLPTAPQDSKAYMRFAPAPTPVRFPTYMFLTIPSAGVVDVVEIAGLTRVDVDPGTAGVQSITAPGATVVRGYWR